MENYHIIEVSFLGPTNTRGSRVKMRSLRFKDSKVIDFNHKFNHSLDHAVDYLTKNGFNVVGQAEDDLRDKYLVMSTTFEPLKK